MPLAGGRPAAMLGMSPFMPYSMRPARRRRSAGGRILRSRVGSVLRWLLPRLIVGISNVLFRTCRLTYIGKEHENRFLDRGLPIIFAGWHEGIVMLPFHFRDRTRGVVMVSASRDGDIIADTVERFGLTPVRGSGGHGGRAALDAMVDAVQAEGVSAGIIVDGPRGPARVAKVGAVALSRATGLPIVPGTWWAKPFVRFGSWDGTLLPLPFSRIVFAFEESMLVPATADDIALEGFRVELTARLHAARASAQRALGYAAA